LSYAPSQRGLDLKDLSVAPFDSSISQPIVTLLPTISNPQK
jgi:hypothetical protein